MRIDLLKTTPDRAGRYWITFEDDTKLALYRQTVEDFGLYTGMELTEGEYEKLLTAAGAMSAKMRAVRIVSATNVSRRDLEDRLVRKGEGEEQAKAAVQWLAELNLVDDRNTARQIVDSCVRKGYGLQRAKQALYEKQIPKDLWEEVLADYPDQTERIADFLRTQLRDPDDPRQVRRAIDAALRRGHSYGDVKRALEQIGTESEFEEDY